MNTADFRYHQYPRGFQFPRRSWTPGYQFPQRTAGHAEDSKRLIDRILDHPVAVTAYDLLRPLIGITARTAVVVVCITVSVTIAVICYTITAIVYLYRRLHPYLKVAVRAAVTSANVAIGVGKRVVNAYKSGRQVWRDRGKPWRLFKSFFPAVDFAIEHRPHFPRPPPPPSEKCSTSTSSPSYHDKESQQYPHVIPNMTPHVSTQVLNRTFETKDETMVKDGEEEEFVEAEGGSQEEEDEWYRENDGESDGSMLASDNKAIVANEDRVAGKQARRRRSSVANPTKVIETADDTTVLLTSTTITTSAVPITSATITTSAVPITSATSADPTGTPPT
ncbi:hypothetical protein DFS34DRAFT_691970 [Phlyctochytrium arcticum]|nr:hypothetical protein DFS34DRAFT_691970 [Phlyctochytrium arcticum]